jgi:hypothetical protein
VNRSVRKSGDIYILTVGTGQGRVRYFGKDLDVLYSRAHKEVGEGRFGDWRELSSLARWRPKVGR